MHCWPRVQESVKEIHRVLKPGGKVFASTFLTKFDTFFGTKSGDNSKNEVNPIAQLMKPIQEQYFKRKRLQSGFQMFQSVEALENYFLSAGFERNHEDKVQQSEVEALEGAAATVNEFNAAEATKDFKLIVRREGRQCVIIKAEKKS